MSFSAYNTKLCFYYFQSRIQELSSAENREEGRVPRTIECELIEDLVDCCIPGEVVTVAGIVKVLNNHMDVGGGTILKKLVSYFSLFISEPSWILYFTLFQSLNPLCKKNKKC